MGFIKLNRYGDPSGCVFDAAAVVEVVLLEFHGVEDHDHVRADDLVEKARPGHELRLMDRDEHGRATYFPMT